MGWGGEGGGGGGGEVQQLIFFFFFFFFVETDHEIFSTVILSLLLSQEGQLSVSGKRLCTNIG